MRMKIHIGILVLMLTCLGVVSQQQAQKANQEIVFHFMNFDASSTEAQNTISIVRAQLHEIGANQITLSSSDNGTLKISYYSDVDVLNVKEKLWNRMKLRLDFDFENQDSESKHSSNNPKPGFNLDIYEIQSSQQSSSGFDHCVLVKKSEIDRFFEPNSNFDCTSWKSCLDDFTQKVAFKSWIYYEIRINNTSNVFPEVRAGPFKNGRIS